MKTFGHMAGRLLLRTLDRAQRIHLAMLCRGFDGTIRIGRKLRLSFSDIAALLAGTAIMLLMRCYDLPVIFGRFLTGITS